MKVRDIMTRDVQTLSPAQSIKDAARCMSQEDIGAVPIAENDRLVGMITDRDIAIPAIAEGKGPETKLRDVMTEQVKYCFEDEDVGHLADNMAKIQMRRLPVLNREKHLVGIVSLGDLAAKADQKKAGAALGGISQPIH